MAAAESYTVEGLEISITPSIGITSIPDDGSKLESLSRNADVAMNHAKESGRNNYQFFSDEMTAGASERLAIEHCLINAAELIEIVQQSGLILGIGIRYWPRHAMRPVTGNSISNVTFRSP